MVSEFLVWWNTSALGMKSDCELNRRRALVKIAQEVSVTGILTWEMLVNHDTRSDSYCHSLHLSHINHEKVLVWIRGPVRNIPAEFFSKNARNENIGCSTNKSAIGA